MRAQVLVMKRVSRHSKRGNVPNSSRRLSELYSEHDWRSYSVESWFLFKSEPNVSTKCRCVERRQSGDFLTGCSLVLVCMQMKLWIQDITMRVSTSYRDFRIVKSTGDSTEHKSASTFKWNLLSLFHNVRGSLFGWNPQLRQGSCVVSLHGYRLVSQNMHCA